VLSVDHPPDRPADPALRLHHPGDGRRKQVGSYQMLTAAPPAGSVAALRYRARAGRGEPKVAVYASTYVDLRGASGPVADRFRSVAEAGPQANLWLNRTPGWVLPGDRWQTFVVVTEFPPPPAEVRPHQVVIDTTAGQAWVDDVHWFVWPTGDRP
jgi:hypothetical protein